MSNLFKIDQILSEKYVIQNQMHYNNDVKMFPRLRDITLNRNFGLHT